MKTVFWFSVILNHVWIPGGGYWVYSMCFINLICLFQVVYSARQSPPKSKEGYAEDIPACLKPIVDEDFWQKANVILQSNIKAVTITRDTSD